MDWNEIMAEKAELTKRVVAGLGEVERGVLAQLLKFEKRERGRSKPQYVQVYKDALNNRVSEP